MLGRANTSKPPSSLSSLHQPTPASPNSRMSLSVTYVTPIGLTLLTASMGKLHPTRNIPSMHNNVTYVTPIGSTLLTA